MSPGAGPPRRPAAPAQPASLFKKYLELRRAAVVARRAELAAGRAFDGSLDVVADAPRARRPRSGPPPSPRRSSPPRGDVPLLSFRDAKAFATKLAEQYERELELLREIDKGSLTLKLGSILVKRRIKVGEIVGSWAKSHGGGRCEKDCS